MRIEARPINIPLVKPFKFATYELTSLPYAWVRIETGDGIVGFGECPTYWDPSGETQSAAVGALELFARSVRPHDDAAIRSILRSFAKLAGGARAAMAGLDAALLHVSGVRHGVSAGLLLGDQSNVARVNAVLGLWSNVDEALATVDASKAAGFTVFKLKDDGTKSAAEIEIVIKAIKFESPGSRVFVDANQSWGNRKDALRRVNQMEDLGVDWIEQPVMASDIEGMQLICGQSTASIIADESCYTPEHAYALAKANAADMFNIKLAKCGGSLQALDLHAIATASCRPCVLGSMVESSLGMYANYHVARSLPFETCGMAVYADVRDGLDPAFEVRAGELLPTSPLGVGLGYVSSEFEPIWDDLPRSGECS